MDFNTLVRYALTGLTEGARILRYVFITALLFTFFTIGASFGHLTIGNRVIVWQALLVLTAIIGTVIGFWRRWSAGWWINIPGLLIVAITGSCLALRLIGPGIAALYVLMALLLIGGALSTGTILGYGIIPGPEATIAKAPSGKVFGYVMLVTFWLVLTIYFVGVAAPLTEPLYIATILGLALIVIPGSIYIGIEKTITRIVLITIASLMIIGIGVAILDSLHTLGVFSTSPVKTLWKGATQDQCAITRDNAKDDINKKIAANEAWRIRNAVWLAAGSSIAKQSFARYESGQAMLNQQLVAADEKYKICKSTGSGSTLSLTEPSKGWLHAILYEWPWWITMGVAPFIVVGLFGLVFLKNNPSDNALDRFVAVWVFWIIIVIILRNI